MAEQASNCARPEDELRTSMELIYENLRNVGMLKAFVKIHNQQDELCEEIYSDPELHPDEIWRAFKDFEGAFDPDIGQRIRKWIERWHTDLIRECQVAKRAVERGGARILDRGKPEGSLSESVTIMPLIREAERLSHEGIGFVLHQRLDDLPRLIEARLAHATEIHRVHGLLAEVVDLGPMAISGIYVEHSKRMTVDQIARSIEVRVKKRGWPRTNGKASLRQMAGAVPCTMHMLRKTLKERPRLKTLYLAEGGSLNEGSGSSGSETAVDAERQREVARLTNDQEADRKNRQVRSREQSLDKNLNKKGIKATSEYR